MTYREQLIQNMESDDRLFRLLTVTFIIGLALCFCIPKKLFETNEKLADFIMNQLLITTPIVVMILYAIYVFFIE